MFLQLRTVRLFTLLAAVLLAMTSLAGTASLRAQDTAPLDCSPTVPAATPAATPAAEIRSPNTEGLMEVTVGYTPVSIFAPMFVAQEKGYFAEQGLDVTLEPLPGGADIVVLTATGDFDAGLAGVGPAFWNAMAAGLPLEVIAPGHQEGSPVATPLMISQESCESGAITSVADLEGKRVAVNARGATEYWLAQALGTAGLTLDDIDLQELAFPDAIAALQSGALDASMMGEPLATRAEQEGIAVRLLSEFPVQDIQPTMIFANSEWLADNPEAATGLATGYLQAARDLTTNFNDPVNLAIIEEYTNVPADLVASSVKPVYAVDGEINVEGLRTFQTFFREREQLDYDQNLDPESFIATDVVDGALERLGPYEG